MKAAEKRERLTIKEGAIVWARDPRHPNYTRWGKGIFVGVGHPFWGASAMFLIEYLDEEDRSMGVCGLFPEMRATTPKPEERLERVRL